MTAERILLFDVETNGLDPDAGARAVEIGHVLWSVRHRAAIETFSSVMRAPHNDCEAVNGIPAELVKSVGLSVADDAWELSRYAAKQADAVFAHHAIFDRRFAPDLHDVWVCTIEDFEWPRGAGGSQSLVQLALAHGVGVVSAHRAITDCLTLMLMLERLPDAPERIDAAIARAKRPKATFVSLAPFEEKDVVKAHGFAWHDANDPRYPKKWVRYMAIEDAAKLPFRVRQVEDAGQGVLVT